MATKTTAPSGADSSSADQAKLPAAASANGQVPATAEDVMFEQHAGAGLQNVTARDILIPRIAIVQSNSPQLLRNKPEFIDGVKIGDIIDVNMGEIIGEEMMFIPILFSMAWLEWAPRDSGKGLQAIHNDASILDKTHPEGGPQDSRRPVLDNGNYIAETAQFYGINVTAERRLSFLPMASTQLKKARQLNTLATSEKVMGANGEFTPPLFYRMYKFTTVPESNNRGDWMGWKIERGPRLQDMEGWKSLFEKMVTYSKEINEGARRGDLSGLQDDAANGESTASADENSKM